ncbi:MAG: DUF1028 domain-containing protein [Alphaproteobacteria bacterium]|nr:DUF1028 domain-containing protein [Alphaproteobacteria bacterium]
MTYSILARDPETGAMGGAAATGSLCVGGWVLRGDARHGLSASQGASPSTFWGEDVLRAMGAGTSAGEAVDAVVFADKGRQYRQLAAIDCHGRQGHFTGDQNLPQKGARLFANGVAAGNTLSSEEVLDVLVSEFSGSTQPLAERLLGALDAARKAGGDSRGQLSAALLVVSRNASPLTLRIDHSEDPITDLQSLYSRATQGDYANWIRQVPTHDDPHRILDESTSVHDGIGKR